MLPALGPLSTALDAIQSLMSSGSSHRSTASGHDFANQFDPSGKAANSGGAVPAGASGSGQLAPITMTGLLAAQSATGSAASANPSDALKDLFKLLDADGNGTISKSEFESALGAGGTNVAQADDVFSKLDKNGDGSVNVDEMASALRGQGHHHAHHAGHGGSGKGNGAGPDSLFQALQGASSNSVSNSDGSTTTSITYADGSKVSMTSPAANTGSGAATSSYNFIERMMAREAQALASSAKSPLSVTA
jgi:EF hand domain-containing protein